MSGACSATWPFPITSFTDFSYVVAGVDGAAYTIRLVLLKFIYINKTENNINNIVSISLF